jgi:hypothetical protein
VGPGIVAGCRKFAIENFVQKLSSDLLSYVPGTTLDVRRGMEKVESSLLEDHCPVGECVNK